MLVISNWPRASSACHFEITRAITPPRFQLLLYLLRLFKLPGVLLIEIEFGSDFVRYWFS